MSDRTRLRIILKNAAACTGVPIRVQDGFDVLGPATDKFHMGNWLLLLLLLLLMMMMIMISIVDDFFGRYLSNDGADKTSK